MKNLVITRQRVPDHSMPDARIQNIRYHAMLAVVPGLTGQDRRRGRVTGWGPSCAAITSLLPPLAGQ